MKTIDQISIGTIYQPRWAKRTGQKYKVISKNNEVITIERVFDDSSNRLHGHIFLTVSDDEIFNYPITSNEI